MHARVQNFPTFNAALVRLVETPDRLRKVMLATIAAILAATFVLGFGFYRASVQVDLERREAEQTLVDNYLAASGEAAVDLMSVQLVWDEAVNNIGNEVNTVWADDYIGSYFWGSFGFEHTLLVSPDGKILREWKRGEVVDRDRLETADDWMLTFVDSLEFDHDQLVGGIHQPTGWPLGRNGMPLPCSDSGLVGEGEHVSLAVVMEVLPDYDLRQLANQHNLVVALKDIDEEFLGKMGRDLSLKEPRLAFDHAMSDEGNATSLTDPLGRELALIEWSAVPFNESLRVQMQPLMAIYVLVLIIVGGGAALILSATWRAMRELTVREAQAHHNALHDAMTGLPNRASFFQSAKAALANRASDERVLLAHFDVDHFKVINDSMGHHVGDELVIEVARRLREQLAPGDFVARLGGDEFVVVRKAGDDAIEAADRLGRELQNLMVAPFSVFGRACQVSISCGIAWGPDHGVKSGELLRDADIAMYHAKNSGRARFFLFSAEMDESARWRHEVEQELRQAIANDGLSLAYQPILPVDGGGIGGVEALLRWDHPARGPISPGVFVSVAEQSGLMSALGWWVMRRAFLESARWPDLYVTINLSPLQFAEHQFVAKVEDLVAECGIDPGMFVFEVTENVMLEANERLFATFARLRELGFRLALDDFGSGYSSLGYLKQFKFDVIKVDRGFVQNIESDLDSLSILKAIASLGRTMGMRIVAEGVETPLQRRLVVAAGCDLIQGHLHWPALEPDLLADLLTESDQPEAKAARLA